MTTESQKQQILNELLLGVRLTGLDILRQFGCLKASNRCSELKAEGYPIKTEIIKVKTKFGEKRVAQYRIENLKEAKKLSGKNVN